MLHTLRDLHTYITPHLTSHPAPSFHKPQPLARVHDARTTNHKRLIADQQTVRAQSHTHTHTHTHPHQDLDADSKPSCCCDTTRGRRASAPKPNEPATYQAPERRLPTCLNLILTHTPRSHTCPISKSASSFHSPAFVVSWMGCGRGSLPAFHSPSVPYPISLSCRKGVSRCDDTGPYHSAQHLPSQAE
jgi:hypothetical protein